MDPTFIEEKKLWKNGYKFVAGLDEAGRGPLAGPVAAGVVMVDFRRSDLLKGSDLNGLRDSKQLSPKKREKFYKILTKHPAIKWEIGIVSEKVIDKINILEAAKLAMVKAVENLKGKYGYLGCPTSPKIKGDVGHPEILRSKNMTEKKDTKKEENKSCPLCQVSEETIKKLKEEAEKKKNRENE